MTLKPMIVEIEVNSRCNRRCSYCPVSGNPTPAVPRLMRDELFNRLLHQLAHMGFDGRLSYHFYNEPLIRKDLERLVASARSRLPGARQVLFTNGDLLTDERYKSLLDAGIEQFIVTRHGWDALDARPHQVVLVPSDLELTNRGGTLFKLDEPLLRPCFAPDEMLIVTVTGDVVLCYEDADRQEVMGNIMDAELSTIWWSPAFEEIRSRLRRSNRTDAASICRNCNNLDHTSPRR